MALAQTSKAAEIRSRLDHPIIDADGHTVECEPLFLEYAVGELGFKTIVIASHVRRAVPAVDKANPGLVRHALWLDTYGLDSAYDYDPF